MIVRLFLLSTFSANLYKNESLSFRSLISLLLGKPKAIIPAGIKVTDKIHATATPKAVNSPKYLIG